MQQPLQSPMRFFRTGLFRNARFRSVFTTGSCLAFAQRELSPVKKRQASWRTNGIELSGPPERVRSSQVLGVAVRYYLPTRFAM